jgi:hypothetical protein
LVAPGVSCLEDSQVLPEEFRFLAASKLNGSPKQAFVLASTENGEMRHQDETVQLAPRRRGWGRLDRRYMTRRVVRPPFGNRNVTGRDQPVLT